jgi:hypothetical protein
MVWPYVFIAIWVTLGIFWSTPFGKRYKKIRF